jgi:hypothetical protein
MFKVLKEVANLLFLTAFVTKGSLGQAAQINELEKQTKLMKRKK